MENIDYKEEFLQALNGKLDNELRLIFKNIIDSIQYNCVIENNCQINVQLKNVDVDYVNYSIHNLPHSIKKNLNDFIKDTILSNIDSINKYLLNENKKIEDAYKLTGKETKNIIISVEDFWKSSIKKHIELRKGETYISIIYNNDNFSTLYCTNTKLYYSNYTKIKILELDFNSIMKSITDRNSKDDLNYLIINYNDLLSISFTDKLITEKLQKKLKSGEKLIVKFIADNIFQLEMMINFVDIESCSLFYQI